MHIFLAGPPGLLREGIARILREFGDSTEVRCVDDLAVASEHNATPDLIVLDGDFGGEASEVVSAARDRMPSPVVVLLTTIGRPIVEKLLAAGASGCVDKSASPGVLLGALRLVLAGGVYLPPSLLVVMAEKLRPPPCTHEQAQVAPEGHGSDLTPRQIEVLALVARGESNKAIARQLDISEGTVKMHLTAVYKALKVNSRSQATNIAMRRQTVIDEQARRAFAGNISIGRLMPHMTPRHFKARGVLFNKGDATDALYYVVRGVIRLEEVGLDVGPGTLLGEIGLFTPERRRTSTARCKTDSELLSITATDAMRIYYQDPEFAVYVIHLITRRLEADKLRAQSVNRLAS